LYFYRKKVNFSVCSSFQILNNLTDFYETWYEYYATCGNSTTSSIKNAHKEPKKRNQEHNRIISVLLRTHVLRRSECGQIVGSPCQFGRRGNQTTHLKLANQYCEQAVTHDPSSKVTRYATWQGYDPRDLTSTLTSLKITYLSFSAELHYENQPILLCDEYATFVLMAKLTSLSQKDMTSHQGMLQRRASVLLVRYWICINCVI
jgi:hypothetical protein